MINKVYRSKLDIENLSRLRTFIPSDIDSFNYKGIVVNKPWGYEYLLFENSYVAIWILFLKYNHSTSMHCHPTKKTSLHVLSGKVICSTLDGWMEKKKGEGLIIDDAVFHSTKALSRKGAFIMEIESPPNKKDLVRLKDGYGREELGYEGVNRMSKDFASYEYIDFHSDDYITRPTKFISGTSLKVCLYRNPQNIHDVLKQEDGEVICMLKGKLHDADGKVILSTGESDMRKNLISNNIVAFGDVMYLAINHKKIKQKI